MRTHRRPLLRAALLGLVLLAAPTAAEDRVAPGPDPTEGIGLDQKPGVQLPLDATFVDERGKPVKLGDYFDGERPVILNLVYFKCPMLCGLVLNGMTEALKGLDWTPGGEFRIVTLSFDPSERGTNLVRMKKQNYLKEYGRPEAAGGWHFLTGREEQIRRVSDTVGFRYKWVEETQEFGHPLVIMIVSPDGVVSHYMPGIQFETADIRKALQDSAEGKIGSPVDKFLFWCGRFVDADNPGYAIMKLGGIFIVLALGLFLLPFWFRSRRRAAAAARQDETSPKVDSTTDPDESTRDPEQP
jgi:protein SCO1/2